MILGTSGQAQEEAGSPQREPAAQEEPTQTLSPPLRVDVVEDETPSEASEREEQEAREREIADADLAAQEGMNVAAQAMNEATQRMAEYAFWSTVLVGVGTVLLLGTLWLTRQANWAAQEAVRVTQRIGEAQVRAYMTLRPEVEWVSDPEEPENRYVLLHIKGSNTGQTPAMIQGTFAFTGRLDAKDIGFDPRTRAKPLPIPDLQCGPGSGIPISLGRYKNEKLKNAIDEKRLIVRYAKVLYRDVFGKDQEVEVAFEHVIREVPPADNPARVKASVVTRSYPLGARK